MAHKTDDRVQETTTTTGTGALTLAGAVTGFQAFSAVCANNDTCFYSIFSAGSEWEVGLGTWGTGNILTRTTVINSSNAGAAVTLSAGTKTVILTGLASRLLQLDNELTANLPAVTVTAVSVPPTDTLDIFARKVGGRMLLKQIGPSGLDTAFQPAIFGNKLVTFNPSSGTVGTGAVGFSTAWTSNGTVTHPTPATTAPAKSNQMKRTRYANVATTQNQQLGPRMNTVAEQQFWRGNAAGLGGFFFATRFIVELWAASTCRIFAGLTASATGSVVISDTVLNNTCGLWHDTTDANTTFNFVTRDATTTTKQTITVSNAIAAGNSYEFYMFCAPNGTTIFWELYDIVNNVRYTGSQTTTLPANTAFMQPQTQMSNGTANTTVTTVAIGVAGIYVESDY